MTPPRRSWRALSLLCFALLVAQVSAKSHKDDRNWGMPSKSSNTSSSDKKKNDGGKSSSSSSKKKKHSKKKDKNKLPDLPGDDDDDNGDGSGDSEFKASFTFFPQSDFTSNLNAFLNSNNHPNNSEEKKLALQKRLKAFVREKMVDHDEVDKKVKRTRQEWEEFDIEQHMKAIEAAMKMGSFLLRSPPVKKLMSSREAQESLRQLVLAIKLLLEDPERARVYGDSDQWQAMFDKFKKWDGASQESLLESLIEYLEHKGDKD